MDEQHDAFRRLIDAAVDCQIRMQAEVGLERLERYLATMAPFMEWCRDRERTGQLATTERSHHDHTGGPLPV